MRKSIVSGTGRMRSKSKAEAAATSEHMTPARTEHVDDPALAVLERSHGRLQHLESPTGRAAPGAQSIVQKPHSAHAPKIDSPPRSPQSSKLEASRAATGAPTARNGTVGGAPTRALNQGGENLTFVRDDVAHGAAVDIITRPREPFVPTDLSVYREPEGVGGVHASHWRLLGLSVDGTECLKDEHRESGIAGHEASSDHFTFVACPAGAPIILRARNDSGRPACLQAVLAGHAMARPPAPPAPETEAS
jgi:hypothetical protein